MDGSKGTANEARQMIVDIALAAENDLSDGYWFYERQSIGLGDYFRSCLFSDIDSLTFFGGIHEIHFGFHRALSKRFPYGIFYAVDGQRAVVVAVLDLRREPLWVREKLGDR